MNGESHVVADIFLCLQDYKPLLITSLNQLSAHPRLTYSPSLVPTLVSYLPSGRFSSCFSILIVSLYHRLWEPRPSRLVQSPAVTAKVEPSMTFLCLIISDRTQIGKQIVTACSVAVAGNFESTRLFRNIVMATCDEKLKSKHLACILPSSTSILKNKLYNFSSKRSTGLTPFFGKLVDLGFVPTCICDVSEYLRMVDQTINTMPFPLSLTSTSTRNAALWPTSQRT